MKNLYFKHLIFLSYILFVSSACGTQESTTPLQNSSADYDQHVYYGDLQNNTVISIDLKTMTPLHTIRNNGTYPYEVTNGYDHELLILNRHDNEIGIIKDGKLDREKILTFHPRSIALNCEQKSILVSSTSMPAETTLSSHALIYHDSSYKTPQSYGGKSATGHPLWINDSYFLLLDRTESSIELYQKGNPKIIAKLHTSSSVHHLVKNGAFYYGSMEGIQGKVSPGIIKFKVAYKTFKEVQERQISEFKKLPKSFHKERWGFHHLAFHPDKKHIYVGSYEGNVFVLNSQDLSLVDYFKAGRGAGHFLFYHDSMIVTNHYDTFKSIYNTKNPTHNIFIKNITLGNQREEGKIMQSHTSHIVDDTLYFMYNDTNGSTFYGLNLKNFTLEKRLHLPSSYCVMGALKSTINSAFSDM